MTQRNKANRTTPLRNRQGRQHNPGPQGTGRVYTGLFLLLVFLASVFALWKPLAPLREYAVITAPAGTDSTRVEGAVRATGALPSTDAVNIRQDGVTFTVTARDPKTPLTTDVWQKLIAALPAQLSGAKVEYRADPVPVVNLGLDLQGGLRIVMKARGANTTRDDLDKVRTIIENRVNQTGVAEPIVQVQGSDRVVVELPGLAQGEQDRALRLIGQTAKLEFRIVNDAGTNKDIEAMTLDDLGPVEATGEIVRNAQAGFDQFGRPQVNMEFTGEGASKIANLTGRNIGKRMAIVLDGRVKTAPTIQGQLGANGQITGIGSVEEAGDIALVLRSGALPVPVDVIETRAIGPTLGQDAIRSGLLASIVGIAAVFVLAFVYYGFWLGLVAALGLIFSGVAIFGLLSGLGAVLTLPGIAGLVLTIGAAVDGNVISFERIKEELRLGKSIKLSVRAGFDHSFATIFDVNFCHLLSALALYSYSTGPVKGFAVTLAVGVFASTFSNLVFSRWLLEVMASVRNFSAPQWFATPKVNFMRSSRIVTTTSVLIAVIGALVLGVKGFVWGVDFTSGTSVQLRTATNVGSGDVRTALANANVPGASASGATIIESQTIGTDGKDFTIRVGELSSENVSKLGQALATLPKGHIVQTETVGPAVGNELRQLTIIAVLVALGLTLVYVWLRFDLIFGIGSVLAVAHDVAIVLGLYSLLGLEFTITTVAGVLTLIGYSLNDSIIVSDRIRENLKLMRTKPYAEIVNVSINQTLSRTLMTSVATMLPLVALLILGGPVLRDFSLVLIIGIFVGTYSSIYIVAPMAVYYKDWQAKRRRTSVVPKKV